MRFIYLTLFIMTVIFGIAFTLGAFFDFISDRDLGSFIGFLASLFVLYIANLFYRKWSSYAEEQINSKDVIQNSKLLISGVLASRDAELIDSLLIIDSDKRMIELRTDKSTKTYNFGDFKLYIQNIGIGAGRRILIENEEQPYVFWIAKSSKSVEAIANASIANMAIGPLGTLSAVESTVRLNDNTILYPHFDSSYLYYWDRYHKAKLLKNKISPSLFGVFL